MWQAEQVLNGANFIIAQHGGGHGMYKNMFHESHQLKICSKFLSWGWTDASDNIVPSVVSIKTPKIRASSFPKKVVYLQDGDPLYSLTLMSKPLGNNLKTQLSDVEAYYNHLSASVQRCFLFKPYPNNYGWQSASFQSKIFEEKSLPKKASLNQIFRDCRLLVSGCNKTSWLLALAKNIPFVIYWNIAHWESRDSFSATLSSQ